MSSSESTLQRCVHSWKQAGLALGSAISSSLAPVPKAHAPSSISTSTITCLYRFRAPRDFAYLTHNKQLTSTLTRSIIRWTRARKWTWRLRTLRPCFHGCTKLVGQKLCCAPARRSSCQRTGGTKSLRSRLIPTALSTSASTSGLMSRHGCCGPRALLRRLCDASSHDSWSISSRIPCPTALSTCPRFVQLRCVRCSMMPPSHLLPPQ
mmetsp:Transcript_11392/g.29178  ORF Transcript_11392/g.29178 Transcript_11392/m.29178 type:complete len:208 (+) Transcript_11392:862-1485(+)